MFRTLISGAVSAAVAVAQMLPLLAAVTVAAAPAQAQSGRYFGCERGFEFQVRGTAARCIFVGGGGEMAEPPCLASPARFKSTAPASAIFACSAARAA